MNKLKSIAKQYNHAIPLIIYGVIYMTWFCYLEKTVTNPSRLIHMRIDDYIPFCEYFVIPYFLWFVYVAVVVGYLFFTDKKEYIRACVFLFTGMTIFLLISTLWPNGHKLRPVAMPRDNIFTRMIASLWRTDTPTNLWPSIHVYNSIGAHLAVCHTRKLAQKPLIKSCSFVLAVAIILSTVLIKQHSVFDVLTAFVMATVMNRFVYHPRTESVKFKYLLTDMISIH